MRKIEIYENTDGGRRQAVSEIKLERGCIILATVGPSEHVLLLQTSGNVASVRQMRCSMRDLLDRCVLAFTNTGQVAIRTTQHSNVRSLAMKQPNILKHWTGRC